jgi:hypothetical protein
VKYHPVYVCGSFMAPKRNKNGAKTRASKNRRAKRKAKARLTIASGTGGKRVKTRQKKARGGRTSGLRTTSVPRAFGSTFTGSTAAGTCTVSHVEYVGGLTQGADADAITSYVINPANTLVFPWLAGIAPNFEYYHFKSLVFEFRSVVSTGTPGTYSAVVDYDSRDDKIASKDKLLNYAGAKSANVWMSSKVSCKQTKKLYVQSPTDVPSGTDIRLYNLGNYNWVVSDTKLADGAKVGELYITYTCTFSTPKPLDLTTDTTSPEYKIAISSGHFLRSGADYPFDIDGVTTVTQEGPMVCFPSWGNNAEFLVVLRDFADNFFVGDRDCINVTCWFVTYDDYQYNNNVQTMHMSVSGGPNPLLNGVPASNYTNLVTDTANPYDAQSVLYGSDAINGGDWTLSVTGHNGENHRALACFAAEVNEPFFPVEYDPYDMDETKFPGYAGSTDLGMLWTYQPMKPLNTTSGKTGFWSVVVTTRTLGPEGGLDGKRKGESKRKLWKGKKIPKRRKPFKTGDMVGKRRVIFAFPPDSMQQMIDFEDGSRSYTDAKGVIFRTVTAFTQHGRVLRNGEPAMQPSDDEELVSGVTEDGKTVSVDGHRRSRRAKPKPKV